VDLLAFVHPLARLELVRPERSTLASRCGRRLLSLRLWFALGLGLRFWLGRSPRPHRRSWRRGRGRGRRGGRGGRGGSPGGRVWRRDVLGRRQDLVLTIALLLRRGGR